VHKNLANKSNNFEDADKDLAFAVWYVEKEFHVGMVDEHFPLMKFFNLYDEYNIQKYNDIQTKSTGASSGTDVKTMG